MHTIMFKGNKVSLEGSPVKQGLVAPEFTLTGEDLKDVHLKDFKKRACLIYVAPSLDTPVCLISTKKISQMAQDIKEADFIVVTADLPFAQKRICGLEHISNLKTLSMMRNKDFGKNYGLLIKEGPLSGLCARAIMILDQAHKVHYIELVEEVTHEPDYEKAFKALEKVLS